MGSDIPLTWFLYFAAASFSIGLVGVMVRRNAIAVLMAIEIMLNAANVNLVAFWRYGPVNGYQLQSTSWGDGSGVPDSGQNWVIVGVDNYGRLHIRAFDDDGKRVTDTDETKLPATKAGVISTLKQRLPGLLPPHVLTLAETIQLDSDLTSILGQTPVNPEAERGPLGGVILALFVLTVAAAEVAVGIGLILLCYRRWQAADVDRYDSLSG
jgi:NADH:ubiquinone oxidoreductase subunit K